MKQQIADYDLHNRELFVAAFERQEEARRQGERVAELERQNRSLVAKVRKAKRHK